MTVRAVEGKKPYTGGTAITVDENKVISLNLRDENNLIIYDAGDDEIYVDLQLPDEITPTDAFPVGVTTGRVIVDNGWDANGTLICAKTTSGDNIKILYEDNGTLWIDNGTGTFKQIYFKSDVDGIITTLTTYINGELAKKQNGVTSDTAPSNPSEGDLWYDTVNDALKVYDGTNWVATGTGGSGDVVVSTDTGNELSTGVGLWLGTETDFSSISTPDTNTLYIQYKSDGGGGGWTPGVNTLAYYPLDTDFNDASGNGYDLTATNATITTLDGIDCAYYTAGKAINTSAPVGSVRTLSAWVYNITTTGNPVIIGTGANQDSFYGMFLVQFSGVVNISDLHAQSIAGNSISQNAWHHLVAVNDNTTMKIYIDGTLVNSGTHSRTDSSTGISVGGVPFTDQYGQDCTGYISNAIVESVAWSDQDVSDYYDQTKGDYGIS